LIFAEGGTTNGSAIIKLKKGAFFAEKRIKPIFLKYGWWQISPAHDITELLIVMILNLSFPFACFRCEVNILPDFEPNEYFFEKFKDKGQERWEIYAWAIRQIMCKEGGFDYCDVSFKRKMEYENFMHFKTDVVA
jgi:hypothetical protein